MTINALIIDDEAINISNLSALLIKHCPQVKILDSAQSAMEARIKISRLSPDVVFLDIEMPGENGFDLLRSIANPDFEVVFVSAYDTYGILAVKFSALDYLLKPIDIAELRNSVKRVEDSVYAKKQNDRLNNLITMLDQKTPDQNQKIALSVQKETYLLPVKDILRCESTNNYTTFFLINGTRYLISKPLYEYEELLAPYGFIRCHQSHLVNRIHVTKIVNEDSGYLLLDHTADKIPIARQKKHIVKSLLGKAK